jgi:murein L,D-transpeptidase YcbB/YkuD
LSPLRLRLATSAFLCVLCASALSVFLPLSALATTQSRAPHSHSKKKRHSSSRSRRQLAPEPARIKEIQQALTREGVYHEEPTGKWDDATVAAMKNFQQSQGLQPTGKIDALSLQKLGLGSPVAGLAPPSPAPVPDAPHKPR